jgi:DNA repair protein RecO (recombination protein O)
MRYAAEPAFVLHARAWRETSLLVEVLSREHGRVGLVARGVHGPKKQQFRAALQPLQHWRISTPPKPSTKRRACTAMRCWPVSISTN